MKKLQPILILFALALFLLSVPVFGDKPSGWAEEEVSEAISCGLVPEDLQKSYTSPASREDFARIAVRVCLAVSGADGTDDLLDSRNDLRSEPSFRDLNRAHAADVTAAYRLGIVNGRNGTVFDPNTSITREEAAAMLNRTFRVCGGASEQAELSFSDSDDVSAWAKEDVASMTLLGVFRGMGDGTFAPKGTYTREQCVLTALRLWNALAPAKEPDPEPEEQADVPTEAAIITDYFEYSLNADGSLTVLRYIGKNGIIVMQPTLDGHPVTGIASGAFDGYPGIKVCVRDSIQYVEDGAFTEDVGGIYYESEAGAIKAYAEDRGLPAALWDWEEIAFIPWQYRPLDAIPGPNETGAPRNQAVAKTATTQIWCERSPAEKFTYIVEDGGITITGYEGERTPYYAEEFVPLYVSIPREIDGLPVRKLATGCFYRAVFHHLEIPGTVRRIGSYVCGEVCTILTIHVLDGEDFTVGRNTFASGQINHTRFHNNLRAEDESDRDETYEHSKKGIDMQCAIVPEGFRGINGWTPTVFTYPEG
ncbi:MAG: S-layer homology domain-containing protein [Oscillospiraceae bacterium]|nr:S-layer homology domain-containing protein [Oscillospiraceae bacterium]